ncbi:hypothetical protein Mapa_011495 [Marchantia paleacea]|nr:hypothetical protein Mapa_011495 [Marchantia paleacea]
MMEFKFLVLEIMMVAIMLVYGENVRSDSISTASLSSASIRDYNGANSSGRIALRLPMSHIHHLGSKHRPLNCSDKCVVRLLIERAEEASDVSKLGYHSQVKAVQSRVGVNYLTSKHLFTHYATMTVDQGNDAQEVELVVDSGSPLTWFQCKPCKSCFPQRRRVFEPDRSPTSRFLRRGDKYCERIQNTILGAGANGFNCGFESHYGDGSYGSGSVALASFKFQTFDGQSELIIQNIGFACGYKNTMQFNTGFSGILGLSTHFDISIPNQLVKVLGRAFGYCLPVIGSAPDAGWFVLGSDEIPNPASDPAYQATNFRLDGLRGFFYLDVVDLAVSRTALGVPPDLFAIREEDGQKVGGFIVDAGMMITSLDPRVYAYMRFAYRRAVVPILGPRIVRGIFNLDTCWDATDVDTETVPLPPIGLVFADRKYMEFGRTASFFAYRSRRGTPLICLAIGGIAETAFGANWPGSYSQMQTAMWHDVDNALLIWKAYAC